MLQKFRLEGGHLPIMQQRQPSTYQRKNSSNDIHDNVLTRGIINIIAPSNMHTNNSRDGLPRSVDQGIMLVYCFDLTCFVNLVTFKSYVDSTFPELEISYSPNEGRP